MQENLFPNSRPNRADGTLVRVVVERGLDRPGAGADGLTYAVPESLGTPTLGDRVEVPLGRGNRAVAGVVVDVGELCGEGLGVEVQVKPIRRIVGSRSPPSIIELARWISRYYCCPLGMTLAAMVPAAVKKQAGRVTREVVSRQVPTSDTGLKLTTKLASTWGLIVALPDSIFPLEPAELARRLGLASTRELTRLASIGLLRRERIEGVRAAGWSPELPSGIESAPPTLTHDQASAVDAVVRTLGTPRTHLVLGVTGSGKTEVYLRVIEEVIARGESAIVLVPEISLTPQTAGRFIERFGGHGVAVLHSGLSASQRHAQWKRAAEGGARVVVGARSAVFAPLASRTDTGATFPLGLIVVDEEHDHSYKQDQLPRYHARDVAIRRGQQAGCPVILGSATPSLESWHNAAELRRFNLIELPERVGGGVLPTVEVVDLVEERKARTGPDARRVHSIGPRLEHHIARTLTQGGQVILLLNRRGFASYVACPDHRCGWLMKCAYCDVTMVFHRGRRQAAEASRHEPGADRRGDTPVCRCHHCLAEQRLPEACPSCGKRVNTFGFGTQRLEDELSWKFPSLADGRSMIRVDADTMTRASDYFDALDRFARGEARVLLGTQMIAKGLDFPNVRLVGVISADTALNLPDFRSAERTFQLVAQVAGRAGRADADAPGGREHGRIDTVVVQTFNPGEPAIRWASAHDYRSFAREELENRRHAGLPPVTRMARVVCRDEDPARAQASAARIAEALRAFSSQGGTGLRVRGPMDCPISRVAGFFRVAVELTAPTPGVIQSALTAARNQGVVKSDEHTAVDVDPVALL